MFFDRYLADVFHLQWDIALERANFHAALISTVEFDAEKGYLSVLHQRGIIETAPVPGACVFSPVIVIPRSEQGKRRMVVDFRGLNLMFRDVAFDLKDRIRTVRSVRGQAQFFTSIDIKDAFFQIKIRSPKAEESLFDTCPWTSVSFL